VGGKTAHLLFPGAGGGGGFGRAAHGGRKASHFSPDYKRGEKPEERHSLATTGAKMKSFFLVSITFLLSALSLLSCS
jgi:hypothetical protein